ncbi:SWPV1-171 [Shearwaterpox virus]|uniref:SWPV1-171 n=1 Tax=Shearwaterpox virus TaxID=1974596 RepID=A0A1V0S801_CNPV|nr:SWPV1-171 [Shearwaterpox virus]
MDTGNNTLFESKVRESFRKYLCNIANFITIKYNLYFMKNNIYNIIVKNKTKHKLKKNKYYTPYVSFYLLDNRKLSECVNLYIDNVSREGDNIIIMNPITGEISCEGTGLEKINRHINGAISKCIITRSEIEKILETSVV